MSGGPTPRDAWSRVRARTEHALRAGALQPIETESRMVADRGVRFVVRSVSSLRRKDAARAHERTEEKEAEGDRPASNPFLPYDPELFVCDLSATHVCLLNKFNVLDHHLLLVTRTFVDQETWLDGADFAALWHCLSAIGGLGFYNSGADAGASQPHKHLQVVPGSLADAGPAIPVDPLLSAAVATPGTVGRCPRLPFRHALAALPAASDAADVQGLYERLLAAVGIRSGPGDTGPRASAPYNLLVTPHWMLAVPRRRESVHGISVNALGFAGSLFVRDEEQMQRIEREGPMTVLAGVSVPLEAAGR